MLRINKKWQLGFCVMFLAMLSGCGTKIITEYKTKVIAPTDAMLADCLVEAPPARELYMKADLSERERLLIENNRAHIKNATLCNSQKKEVREWKKQQLELYKEPVKTEVVGK